jgi:nucleoside-diphosphate-sugar epimerase
MHFTILGARGFIGSHLVSSLRRKGVECLAPSREERLSGRDLGHLIYCIGLTADFRTRMFDTVEAHVCALLDIIRNCRYDSFLYLSSTRVYKGAQSTSEEAMLTVNPNSSDDIYNISKIMGESLCLTTGNPVMRVARISNVVGSNAGGDNFVNALIAEALTRRKIVLQMSPDSEKDYVTIEDVIELLPRIARTGRHRIYNVASGINRTNMEIADTIAEYTGSAVETLPFASRITFPLINVSRIAEEFLVSPVCIRGAIERIVHAQSKEKGKDI